MPDEFASKDAGAAVMPCSAKVDKPATHWIAIKMLGEGDHPVAWEEYRIKLPDGTEVRGYLDDEGCARVENIPDAGQCEITFPARDSEAWELDQA